MKQKEPKQAKQFFTSGLLRLATLLFLCLSVAFTACEYFTEREDEDNGNSSNTFTGAMSTSGKRIKKMIDPYGDVHNFAYDAQGRILSYVESCDDDWGGIVHLRSYSYDRNTIEVSIYRNGVERGREVFMLSNNRIVSWTAYEADGTIHMKQTFEYRDENFVKCNYYESDGEMFPYHLTWNNGNIIQLVEDNGDIEHYNYGEENNHDRLELYWIGWDLDLALVLQGYYGNGTKNRLHQISGRINLSYAYNSDGDVIELNQIQGNSTRTYSFEWE